MPTAFNANGMDFTATGNTYSSPTVTATWDNTTYTIPMISGGTNIVSAIQPAGGFVPPGFIPTPDPLTPEEEFRDCLKAIKKLLSE